jgi:hypothetical protein
MPGWKEAAWFRRNRASPEKLLFICILCIFVSETERPKVHMKKDIILPTVEDIGIAIVREKNAEGADEWNVYLLNFKLVAIEGVLVTSTGYGELNGEPRKTSTLRHFLDTVGPESFVKIEPIHEQVFGLNNEYWLSFYVQKVMYDKQYVFLAESISEANCIKVPLVNKKGVLIK